MRPAPSSCRHRRLWVLALLCVVVGLFAAALGGGVAAGARGRGAHAAARGSAQVVRHGARAHRLSGARRRAIRRRLLRALRRSHGRALGKRWFLRQASLVDFTLPLTLRLSPAGGHGAHVPAAQTVLAGAPGGSTLAVQSTVGFSPGQFAYVFAPGQSEDSATVLAVTDATHLALNAPLGGSHGAGDVVSTLPGGVNQATLDLGPQGVRALGLGGYLPAQLNFRDLLSGGQIGSVEVTIPPVSQVPSAVTTTSVPLLADSNVSALQAPEDSLDAFVVSNSDPGSVSLFFSGHGGSDSGPVSVSSIVSTGGASLRTALAGVTNPLTGTGTVGSGGVDVYAAPFAASAGSTLFPALSGACPAGANAVCTVVLVRFTGASLGASALPALDACTAANGCGGPDDTAAYAAGGGVPVQLVTGQPATTDGGGHSGCASFHGNGAPGDPDLLSGVSASIDPGGAGNVGPGPAYGGSSSPQDTVLRTGPLTASITPQAQVTLPVEDQGPGVFPASGSMTYSVGASGGTANLFGYAVNGLPAGDSMDLTVNLQTTVDDVERQVGSSYPSPPGIAAQTVGGADAYATCRQAWTGGIQGYLTGVHLVGAMRISPGLTADGHLRLARVSLHSPQPVNESLAVCLSPFELYAQGDPFSDDSPFAPLGFTSPVGPNLLGGSAAAFSALVASFGSYLGPGAAFGGAPVPSPAPTAGCDSSGGPLDRSPFAVSPLHGSSTTSATSAADMVAALNNGAAAVASGALTVTNLQAEALVGSVAGG